MLMCLGSPMPSLIDCYVSRRKQMVRWVKVELYSTKFYAFIIIIIAVGVNGLCVGYFNFLHPSFLFPIYSLLKVPHAFPVAVLIIREHLLALPVGRNNFAACWIKYSGHLIGKQLLRSYSNLANVLSTMLKRQNILQEFTWETTEDDNFVIVQLGDTSSLSRWETRLWNLNNFPALFCVFTVESLNWVAVLFGGISDSRKNINVFVGQSAGGMVVTAVVKLGQVEPNIQIDVVLLYCAVGSVCVQTRSSTD